MLPRRGHRQGSERNLLLRLQAPRVEALYRLLYGRAPSAEEVELGVRFVAEAHPAPETKLTPWEQYAQVLLSANEFAFVD